MMCDECIHNDICKIKRNFIEIKDAISKMNISLDDGRSYHINDIDFLSPIEVNCRYFYVALSNARMKKSGL